MIYTVRDSNGDIIYSVESTNVKSEISFESINNELEDINDYSNKLNKSIEAFVFVSDAKAMESFGYRATEGFGNKIKAVGKAMWENIKKFFNMILDYLKKFGRWIAGIFKKDKNDKTSPKTTDKVKNDYKDEKINNYVHDPDVIKRAEDIENEVPIDIIKTSEKVDNVLRSKDPDKINDELDNLNKLIDNKKESKPLSEEKVREVISKDISNMSYSKKTDETNKFIKEIEKIINKLELTLKSSINDEDDIHNTNVFNLANKYITILRNEIAKLTTEQKCVFKTKELNLHIEEGSEFDIDSAAKWLEDNNVCKIYNSDRENVQMLLEACRNDSSIIDKLKYVYETYTKYSSSLYKSNVCAIVPSNIPFNSFMILCAISFDILKIMFEQAKRAIVNDNTSILIPGFLHRVNRSIYNYVEVRNEVWNNDIEILDFEPGVNYNSNTMSIINDVSSGQLESTILVGFKIKSESRPFYALVFLESRNEATGSDRYEFWKIAGKKHMD